VQWYFDCPRTGAPASVLWRPPGASRFASRKAWGRQCAYSSQFLSPLDRADHMKRKICNRIGGPGASEEWEFPPKPKWMRWRTYEKAAAVVDRYEELADDKIIRAAVRILGCQ
jgi:hypothetical protein